jgi:simple sugar transport system permease protein
MISSALPLLFASLGALWTELSGALGIFIEGLMGMGAFAAYCGLEKTGSTAAACLAAAAVCAAAGGLTAAFIGAARANPFIAGIAVNLAADGLTAAFSQVWFGTKGVLRVSAGRAPAFFESAPLIVSAALCFGATAFVVYRTRFGLRLRAAGFSPETALERGVPPARYLTAAWAIAGMLAGIGGACLTLKVGAYTPGGVAGRGWIALAAVYLGFRRVWGAAAAAFVFAFVEQAGIRIQGLSALPPTALLGAPSALALLFYAAASALKPKYTKMRKIRKRRKIPAGSP